jgi:hypothetical protein
MSLLKNRAWTFASLPFLAWLPVACSGGAPGEEAAASDDALDSDALSTIPSRPYRDLCGADAVKLGMFRCHAKIGLTPDGQVEAAAAPRGLAPKDLISAYKVPSGGTGTIGIVDAQDNPNAERDLGTYRKQFGLPACTTANGCFKKVNQRGQQSGYPAPDPGWGGEIMLDIEMASAICPGCKILLVEADSPTTDNLGASVDTAVRLGASVVSNSYGGAEDNTTVAAEHFFNHPGVAIFASSGDSGFGAQSPASSAFVIAVGGTSLTKSGSSRGWAEKAWSGAGAGCSAVISKPSWQTDKGCSKRTIADVSAVADPNTGVAVFDSGSGGWVVFGGTSVSSPVVASIFAATGNSHKSAEAVWKKPADFNDVTTGSDGTCSVKYLCTAQVGFDGPTGWGTPNATKMKAGL